MKEQKNHYIKRFISYYKPHWKLFLIDMVCAVLICLIDLAFPYVTRVILNDLLPNQQYRYFFLLMAVITVCYILRALCQYFVDYWGHLLGVRMEADIRQELFCHLQKQSFTFFDQTRTGQIMSRLVNDLFEIVELAHHGPEDIFISAIMLIGSFTALFVIQWKLALVLLCMVPITVVFIVKKRKNMGQASRKLKEKTGNINSALESSISGIRVAKAFANEDYELEKFLEDNNEYRNSKNGFYKAMGTFHAGVETLACFFGFFVLLVGGLLIMNKNMTVVDMLAANLYVASFLQPVRRLGNFVELFEGGMAGFKRFVELMNVEPDITDKEGAKELKNVKGDVTFSHVTFSYEDAEEGEKEVLSDINLTVSAGKTIGIVGPSGGGKTTLCHLIPRFYEVSEGNITIDGINIKDVTLASLRENVGIVQQDVFLFPGTIRENILYGNVNASEEEMIKAAKEAMLHDFIMSLPQKYDTIVGERGIRLSGGQKQRISIARILLKNPPILILDEATSALDNETEAKIQQSFARLAKGRTTFVIAHRLSTIQDADEIIVIDHEGIKETGTHEELLKTSDIYQRLYYGTERSKL